ncbi:MAG: metallophosphatase family protein [Acidimicrobiaceae bacterium]|nr:metallophosphatase family protein [Acidimicrobiaceae bacterium]
MRAVGGVCRVAVIADTHLRDAPPWRDLPAEAWRRIRRSDVVLHAGDVLDEGILRRFEDAVPTHAVLGNNDVDLVGRLPLTLELELAGVRVAMIHDSKNRADRARRMSRRFPDADLVVFGHSHIPWNDVGERGQVLFNPGSPTTRRAQPTHTMGELELAEGRIIRRRLIDLGR